MTTERTLTKGELENVEIVLSDALPYELSMLEGAARYIEEKEFAELDVENNYAAAFKRNATIEAFWTHARCLIEFFNRSKTNEYEASSASARNLTLNYNPSPDMAKLWGKTTDYMNTRINEQISHVGFRRKAEEWNKLSLSDMRRVKAIINKETKEFIAQLTPAFRTYWKGNQPQAQFVAVLDQTLCTTNAIITMTVVINPGR